MRSKPAPVSTFGRRAAASSAPSALLVELHEHEVPELDVAVPAAVGGAALVAVRRARSPRRSPSTARTGRCRPSPRSCPCRGAGSAPAGTPTVVAPDRLGLVVGDVDGDPDAVAVEAEHLGDELPGPRDGLGLEVVAEAEVAEHLEEGEVAARAADLVEVVVLAPGPHALLDRRRAAARRHAPRRGSTGLNCIIPDGEQERWGAWGSGWPTARACAAARSKKRVKARRSSSALMDRQRWRQEAPASKGTRVSR